MPRSLRSILMFVIGIALYGASTHNAFAATCTFAATEATNSFETTANWNCGHVPNASDVAIIPAATTTNAAADISVTELQVSGTLRTTTHALAVAATTTIHATGMVTSTTGTFTLTNVTSTGALGTVSGSATVSQTFTNNGTWRLGSGSATTSYDVYNTGTIYNDSGTWTIRRFVYDTGTYSAGTGTVVLHSITNSGTYGFVSALATTFNNVTVRGTSTSYLSGLTTAATSTIQGTLLVESGSYDIRTTDAQGPIQVYGRLYNNGNGYYLYAAATTTFYGSGSYYGRQASYTTFADDVIFASGATGGFDYTSSGNEGDQVEFRKRLIAYSNDTYFYPGSSLTVFFSATTTSQTIPHGYAFDHVVVNNPSGVTMLGDATVGDTLQLLSGTFSASTGTLTLSGSGTPFVLNGGQFANTSSTVLYTGTDSTTIASTTYWNLTTSSTNGQITGHTTATNAFTNVGTLTITSSVNVIAPGTFTNSGTITETGAIQHPVTYVRSTDAIGTIVSSHSTLSPTLYITIQDDDGNLDANSIDTLSGVTITTSNGDSMTVTLTETGIATGIFRGGPYTLTRQAEPRTGDALLEVYNAGTLTISYADSKESSDTGSAVTTFTFYPQGGGAAFVSVTAAPLAGSGSSILDVIVNDGAITRSPQLTLKLNADPATVRGYAISLSPSFVNASIEPYQPTVTYTLPSQAGTYTLYIRYYSTTGNASPTIEKHITLAAANVTNQPSSMTSSFARVLLPGSRSADVQRLARYLNSQGYLLAKSGPGSPGQETTYYGPLLMNAVKRFQEHYAIAILKPAGLKQGTGTFGDRTRLYLNTLLQR